MTVQNEINNHLLLWDQFIRHAREAGLKAAQSEAEYKRDRAKFVAWYKATNPGASQVAAESAADANETLHVRRVARLSDDAEVEACRMRNQWFRAKSEALRSEKVDERESSRLYADNPAGA